MPSGTFAFMDTLPEGSYSGMVENGRHPQALHIISPGLGTSWNFLRDASSTHLRLEDFHIPALTLMDPATRQGVECGFLRRACNSVPIAKDLFNPAISAVNWNYDHQAHEDLWPAR